MATALAADPQAERRVADAMAKVRAARARPDA